MMEESLKAFNVEFALQEERLGTGHAIMCTNENFKEYDGDVLVLVGDAPLLTTETVQKLINRHRHQDAAATVLTTEMDDPTGYGRILRHQDNTVMSIVEDKDANIYEKKISEINTGTYVFDSKTLFMALKEITPENEQGEYYLTDVIHIMVKKKQRVEAYVAKDPAETMGINNRVQFAKAERIMRDRILERLMLSGVTIVDPASTFIDDSVEIGTDSIINPTSYIYGKTVIGNGCMIGPLTQIEDCAIGEGCMVNSSYLRACTLHPGMSVGPFANLQHEEIRTARKAN